MIINRQKASQFLQQAILISFNLLFFLTPFIFTWMNQELFEFSKMLFVYLMTIIIATLWLTRMVIAQKIIWQKSKLDYPLLLFLLSQIIATIFSIHPRTSWFGYYTRFNGGLLSTISYITLFYAFIANIRKSQLKAIYASLLLAAFLISLYAIPEHFNHSPSCWLITHKFDTSCWSDNNNPRFRVFATFGQPNWLAAFLIIIIPLGVDLLLKERNKLNKLYLLVMLGVTTLALLFTKSRSGLLGLGLGLIFYAIWQILGNKKQRLAHFLKLTGVAAMMLTIALLAGTAFTPKLSDLIQGQTNTNFSINESVDDSTVSSGGTPSEAIRKIVWQGALKIWQRYPIFGSGVETFAYSYYLDRPIAHNLVSEWDFLYNKAHNELLNYLATTGAVGLATYLAIFSVAFYLGLKQFLQHKAANHALALLAGILAMFVSNFFGFSTVVTNLLLFGFLAMIVIEQESLNQTKLFSIKKIDETYNVSNTEYFIFSFLGIMAIFLISQTWKIWHADYLFTNGQATFEQGNWQTGLALVQAAVQESPKEAFFYDELAGDYAQLSVAFANEQQSTTSAQLAQKAIETNRYALQLNPVHLNFYKSQARIYIRLAQLDPQLYSYAAKALQQAITLAPTDAKLYYNLALILEALGDQETALTNMEYAVKIKANYLQARNELARMYINQGELNKAKDQYLYNLENIAPDDNLVKEKLEAVEASLSAQSIK